MTSEQANSKMIPAKQLTGMTLDGGWKVIKEIERPPGVSGGYFSIGYIVKSPSGEEAYLKAIDLWKVLGDSNPDPMLVLKSMVDAFNYERDLCRRCNEKRLSHVVNILADGKIYIEPGKPYSYVPYLIFELGKGDVRSRLDSTSHFDIAWGMRCLHQIAIGLTQLHGIGVAHQDVKPSNVIVFEEKLSKLTDLGCASCKTLIAPRDEIKIAGDRSYAPPELLYGYIPSDWNKRRMGCDLYLLGSMVVFFFTRTTMSALIFSKMDPSFHFKNWGETYDVVLPYLRHAFGLAIEEFSRAVPEILRERLTEIVQQLCEPDPHRRGHPSDRIGYRNPYSLERYISLFDLLARKAELLLSRG